MSEEIQTPLKPVTVWKIKAPPSVLAALILQRLPEFGWARAQAVVRDKPAINLVQVGEKKK